MLGDTLTLLAAFAFFNQFLVDHFGPSIAATLLCGLVWHSRPSLRIATLILVGFSVAVFAMDCLLLRHRVAVELRTWSLLWDIENIDDIIQSPSGRTTVYIVDSDWLDSAYRAYISDGGLFPRQVFLYTKHADAYYPRDITASWTGSIFTAAEQFVTLRYDESTHQIESFTR